MNRGMLVYTKMELNQNQKVDNLATSKAGSSTS